MRTYASQSVHLARNYRRMSFATSPLQCFDGRCQRRLAPNHETHLRSPLPTAAPRIFATCLLSCPFSYTLLVLFRILGTHHCKHRPEWNPEQVRSMPHLMVRFLQSLLQ